jgi:hypothetical protein
MPENMFKSKNGLTIAAPTDLWIMFDSKTAASKKSSAAIMVIEIKKERLVMAKKTTNIAFTLVFGIFLIFYASNAMAAPPAKSVKEVVDYFYNGQKEGPILIDSNLCKSIKDLECEQAIDPSAVAVGDLIYVWMQFFVPKGGVYDDIMVEYKYEGVPRNLNAHTVEGSIRYRAVDKYKVDKPGKWTVTIKKGMTNLKEFQITVTPK